MCWTFLAARTNWAIVNQEPVNKYVSLVLDPDTEVFQGTPCARNTEEAYHVMTEQDAQKVTITAATSAGVFYGVQVGAMAEVVRELSLVNQTPPDPQDVFKVEYSSVLSSQGCRWPVGSEVCVNLWQVASARHLYRVSVEPGKAAQQCVFILGGQYLYLGALSMCLDLGVRYTYSSSEKCKQDGVLARLKLRF